MTQRQSDIVHGETGSWDKTVAGRRTGTRNDVQSTSRLSSVTLDDHRFEKSNPMPSVSTGCPMSCGAAAAVAVAAPVVRYNGRCAAPRSALEPMPGRAGKSSGSGQLPAVNRAAGGYRCSQGNLGLAKASGRRADRPRNSTVTRRIVRSDQRQWQDLVFAVSTRLLERFCVSAGFRPKAIVPERHCDKASRV